MRIVEAAKLAPTGGGKFRVCLISEGESPRGRYKPEFFTPENAAALAGVLSFPKHPEDYDRPDQRDPLSAIGEIGDVVDIQRDENGKLGFWADYLVGDAETAHKIEKYGNRLGLSVFADGDGYVDNDGKFVYTMIDGSDPYRSVDLVIAPGRGGGQFQKVAESLGLLPKASASAGENEVIMEIKDVEGIVQRELAAFETKIVESLAAKLAPQAPVEPDTAAVDKIVEDRMKGFLASEKLIAEAKLPESSNAALRELAAKGEDIAPHIEFQKKVIAEALTAAKASGGDSMKIAEAHLGDGAASGDGLSVDIAGFGQVKVL